MLAHFKDPVNAIDLPVFTDRLDLFWKDLSDLKAQEILRFKDTGFVRRITMRPSIDYYFDTLDEILKTAKEHHLELDTLSPKKMRVIPYVWGLVYDASVPTESPLLVPEGYHLAADVNVAESTDKLWWDDLGTEVNALFRQYRTDHPTGAILSDLYPYQCTTNGQQATLVDIEPRMVKR